MTIWHKPDKLESRGEIYLQWKNPAIIAVIVVLPLIVALLFKSLVVKIICWTFSLLAYASYLRVQGPCVMAIAIAALPWYIYLELESLPRWLAIVAILISVVEVSYIRHRMRFIKEMREKEDIIL